jgi:hypothetical protein
MGKILNLNLRNPEFIDPLKPIANGYTHRNSVNRGVIVDEAFTIAIKVLYKAFKPIFKALTNWERPANFHKR